MSETTLTDRGAFSQASSAYGTFDQGGNAAEWTDPLFDTLKRVRGGSWWNENIRSTYRANIVP